MKYFMILNWSTFFICLHEVFWSIFLLLGSCTCFVLILMWLCSFMGISQISTVTMNFCILFFFLTVAELIIWINDMDPEGDGLLVLLLISRIVVSMPTFLLVALGIGSHCLSDQDVSCFFEKKIRVHVLTKVYTMQLPRRIL